jgi:hypothetical protein
LKTDIARTRENSDQMLDVLQEINGTLSRPKGTIEIALRTGAGRALAVLTA